MKIGKTRNGDADDVLGALAYCVVRDRGDGAVRYADANVARPAGR